MGASTSPPQPVRLAVTLMYVLAALAVVDVLLNTFVVDTAAQAQATGTDPAVAESLAGVSTVAGVVGGLIAAALWVVSAVFTGRGRQWARILATVLAGLGLLFGLLGLVLLLLDPTVLIATVVLRLAVEVALIVLLWRPLSNRFFAARSSRAAAV